MPEEFDNFLDAINYYNVDDAFTATPEIQGVVNRARRFGDNFLEGVQNWLLKSKTNEGITKLSPQKLSAIRTIAETAFLEPKNISTTLDEVTKPDLKEYITFSKIFQNVSYGVRDLSVTATYKNNNSKYTLRVGDKIGLQYRYDNNQFSYKAGVEQNIYNGKTRLKGSISTPSSSYNVSIYHNDGSVGATVGYSNRSGIFASVSADSDGTAMSVGYNHNYSDCKLSVRGFISTQQQKFDTYSARNLSALVGICGNITM